MKFLILATVLAECGLCFSQEGDQQSSPRVITPLGTVEGYYNTSNGGRRYEAYEGIPYAQPPIGHLRFEVPIPISPWSGVLIAKDYGPRCMQCGPIPSHDCSEFVAGSEDCLYLNVYTTLRGDNESAASLLPVIFFLHGGAFRSGSGMDYRPTYLMDSNITVVTINYRLGTLGFLSTEDEIVPGNMGLKDQVVALRWVQENIKSFGGDPNRVTIVGHSAGGASVHYHYLTNVTKGLFHGGMSISGTALDCWCQTEASLEKARKLASILGCPTSEVRGMVDCLKTRPGHQIVLALGQFTPWLNSPYSPFGPVVEKGGGFTIIDRPPIETIVTGHVQNLPWITSVVSQEGLVPAAEFITSETLLQELNGNWTSIAPELLEFNYTIPSVEHHAVSELIRQHYLGNSVQIDNSTISPLVRMISDRLYVYDAAVAATLQSRAVQSPVLFYYFTYRGNHSFSEYYSGGSTENFGVSHLDDLGYVMDSFFDPTTTKDDREIQEVMINLWVSFAKNGKPDLSVGWNELSKSDDSFSYLRIAGPKDLYMENNENFGQKNFWLGIDFRENTW